MHYGASSRKSKTKMSRILRRVSRNKEVFYPNIVNLSLHDRFVMNLMLVDANTIKNLGIYVCPLPKWPPHRQSRPLGFQGTKLMVFSQV